MVRKTILITGSTDGIGKQTAIELVKKGHRVLIHGRNQLKSEQTAEEIRASNPAGEIDTVFADLSSMAEIHDLVEQVRNKCANIDILINNAGIFRSTREESADGFEMNFAVNYLAPYLLSMQLVPLMNEKPSSRIINVSSVAHKRGRLNFLDLQFQKNYDSYKAYADSKLMLIYLTYELAEKFAVENIAVNALNPGMIGTKLLRQSFNMKGEHVTLGAETPVYLAISPEVKKVTGKYFDKRKPVPSSRLSYELEARQELMAYTRDLVKQ
ncbi:MAG: hypothetical protein BGO78_07900 [Chloroflexi bacterium 44-23]|nr:MAG: hypothetical protein BGO78_07900 [Chloroflexi bacterium 44-23]